jgi:DNA repair protein RadA/Sms
VTGGMRVDDPAAELAVAAALASSSAGVPVPPGRAFVGEVSLTGVVRPVPGLEQRLVAATAAGLGVAVCPGEQVESVRRPSGIRLIAVSHIRDALDWVGDRRSWVGRPTKGR